MRLVKLKLAYILVTIACFSTLAYHYLSLNHYTKKYNFKNIARTIQRLYLERSYDPLLSEGCYSEWVLLNNETYFRRNLAFYYTDTSVVKLYFNRRNSNKNLTLRLEMSLELADATLVDYVLTDLVYKTIDQKEMYTFMSIESNLATKGLKIKDVNSMRVIVADEKISKTKVPIDLIVKEYFSKETSKKHSMVCSKLYYVKRNLAAQFRWWIEMNKMHGYDKVVIYNNSIENSKEFNELFEEYSGFVELIPFKCLPNFIDANNTNKPFISSFFEIKYDYRKNEVPLHVHFETFVFNECYLSNKDKYKYITINDQDETVIPLYLNTFRKIENNLISNRASYLEKEETKCYYDNSFNKSIELYMRKLSTEFKFTSNVTFHFHTAIYMKNKTMNVAFKQLGKLFRNISSNETNFPYSVRVIERDEKNNRGGQMLNFSIVIKNKNELDYAKYLYNLFKSFVKPFYLKNELSLKKLHEPFARFFYLLGPSTTWFCGKTIHNTYLSQALDTHYPKNLNNFKTIPIESGYVSHFRSDYNIYWNDKSIMDFQFDLNYFLCYFKPIAKKFKFEINFDQT